MRASRRSNLRPAAKVSAGRVATGPNRVGVNEDDALADAADRLQERLGPDQDRFAAHQRQTHLQMIEAMKANGMDPAYIYACEQTGITVFQETMHLIPPDDLARWEAAYEEYERRHPR